MDRLQSRAEATKQNLLEVTEHILASEGYAMWSEEYVCQCSGVTRGALRYHFPSGRYDLLHAFARRVVEEQAEKLKTLGTLSSQDRVYLVLMSMAKQLPSKATVALLELWMASRGDKKLAERIQPLMDQAANQMLGENAGESEDELLAIRLIIHGAAMHAFNHDFTPERLQSAIQWILQRLPPPTDLMARLTEFTSKRHNK